MFHISDLRLLFPLVIGVSGAMGAGKDTIAEILVQQHNYTRLAFADALRQEISDCLTHKPVEDEFPDEIVNIMAKYSGMSNAPYIKPVPPDMRYLLQWWGTEYRRMQYGSDYWVKQVASIIQRSPHKRFVISDVRFLDEQLCVYSSGGVSWSVIRHDKFYRYENTNVVQHSSEHALKDVVFDAIIWNDTSISDLALRVDGHLLRYVQNKLQYASANFNESADI